MRTTITTRKKILQLFEEERKEIQQIMAELHLSYFQVYNVIRHRVKTNYSRRSDKGASRKRKFPTKDLSEFNSPDEYLRYQLYETLRQINDANIAPAERLKLIKDGALIEKRIKEWEIEHQLKRPDAVIIARIMRRFDPTLTDDQVIQIFKEEMEKIAREPR